MQPLIRAILLDHDGTFVDSEAAHFQLWATVLKPYGISLSEEQYKRYYAGMPTPANAVDIVRRFGLQVSPSVLASAKETVTRQHLSDQAFPLMPGAVASIRRFKILGLRLALITGASRYGVEATLRAHALDNFFATVVSGDDVLRSKPAPDYYLLAMQRLSVDPTECIAIEDTEHGVAAATSAGITCVAVPTAMSENHDFSLATGIFRNLAEVTQWVATHV